MKLPRCSRATRVRAKHLAYDLGTKLIQTANDPIGRGERFRRVRSEQSDATHPGAAGRLEAHGGVLYHHAR